MTVFATTRGITPSSARFTPIVRSVPRIHVRDVESTEWYYEHATHPFVVEGVDTGVGNLRLHDIAASVAGPTLRVWDWALAQPAYVDVPVGEVVDLVRQGDSKANVVDHPIGDTPLAERVKVPLFLDSNWFYGEDGYDAYSRQLLVTAAGAYTPAHVDGCFQGWMHLLEGRKLWRYWSPEVRPLLLDVARKRFIDPVPPTIEVWEAEQLPGDTLCWPAGWVHQVRTTAPSLGVGGSVVNPRQIEGHVEWWLIERSLGIQGRLPLKRWLEEKVGPELGTELMFRCGAQYAVIEEWERKFAPAEDRFGLPADEWAKSEES